MTGTAAPEGGTQEQLALLRSRVRATRVRAPDPPAALDPVARVAVDVPLPHLDRAFDYLVPESMAAAAVPGARVRVRFAGRLVDGFVLARAAGSEHEGRLAPLSRVVSAEPVLTPEVASLARAVADRYAGTLADVLRTAVPPRHARTEQAEGSADPAAAGEDAHVPAPQGPGAWSSYDGGPALLGRLADIPGPRAVWSALPGEDWPAAVATLALAALSAGGGVLVVVPDVRDAGRVDAAFSAALGAGRHVLLTSDLGPARRYAAFLDVLRGRVRAVVGTRSAVYAPVHDLRLLVLWDDGDDLLAEPQAPYWHAREVLVLRAHETGAALVVGGFGRTPEAAALVTSGWARSLVPAREALRARVPVVRASGSDSELARDPAAATARLPHLAWSAAREGLQHGPVLVQVPRRGYVPALACQRCRTLARCPACAGPLGITSGHAVPTCAWCGRAAGDWRCPGCGDDRLRAVTVGSGRTAEELGRAFPDVPVVTSGGDRVVPDIGGEPALVVATPGAEPVAAGGYAAVLLLDARAQLERPGLRAGEEAVRRWFGAAALARRGAPVVVTADNTLPAVQALVRWDPAGFAGRELADRVALRLPPAARVAAVTGPRPAVEELLELTDLPDGSHVLGPVPVETATGGRHDPGARHGMSGRVAEARVRALVRAPRQHGLALAMALRAAAGVRSARRSGDPVEVRIDPVELG